MNFQDFQNSREKVDSTVFIEILDDNRYHLIIETQEFVSDNLSHLEFELYKFHCE